MPRSQSYAHTLDGFGPDRWQPLIDHLRATAETARDFAADFQSADWGELAGWWHDLGKYAQDFQDRLYATSSDISVGDASIDDQFASNDDSPVQKSMKSPRVDHSSAGAVLVREKHAGKDLPSALKALAMVIAGHHAGLAEFRTFTQYRLDDDRKKARLSIARAGGAPADILSKNPPEPPPFLKIKKGLDSDYKEQMIYCFELWTRMLLSSLVDADRIDTERFCNPKIAEIRPDDRSNSVLLHEMSTRIDCHIDEIAVSARQKLVDLSISTRFEAEKVLKLRSDVLDACRNAAELDPGRFSLTVPTGGGKTLAALSFALRHALKHQLKRVIVVIPFISIIDQTAQVYRNALGDLASHVVEHHANIDVQKETVQNRLATENWDAPIIVTTSVQFLESLFANRPTTLRKIHNIAKSVVVFDESQNLPHHMRKPIFEVLNQLSDYYGVTSLFCSATQPALDIDRISNDHIHNIHDLREIVPDVPSAFHAVKNRVVAEFPHSLAPTNWQDLAQRIQSHERVLVIVHRRDDATDLVNLLPDDPLHLSALICAEHRRDVLKQIRFLLDSDQPCRVVSTTLVEAGVDLDFPVVYRALGGFDSMAQAAGRCNREGKLRNALDEPEPGRLYVFVSPTNPPQGLKLPLSTARKMIELNREIDLFHPGTYHRYFKELLGALDADSKSIMRDREARNFPEVAKKFQVIEEGGQTPLVVPYRDAQRRIDDYRAFPTIPKLRSLQPFLVNVWDHDFQKLQQGGAVETIHDQVHWLSPEITGQYDDRIGLVTREIMHRNPGGLIL